MKKFKKRIFLSFCVWSCFGCGGELDITPPGKIVDLYVEEVTSDSVTLTWRAPGDDGFRGRASRYDIRYATEEITKQNWIIATEVYDEPSPAPAGTEERYTVRGLYPKTRYYFAIRTYDDEGNLSPLSSITSAVTMDVPGGSGEWERVSSPPPLSDLSYFSGVILENNSRIFYYGNQNNLYFDYLSDSWSVFSSPLFPDQKIAFTLNYLPSTNSIFLFGGQSDSGYYNSSWYFDPSTNSWLQISPSGTIPAERRGACAQVISSGEILLFGGQSKSGSFLNDAYIYNPQANRWTYLDIPGAHPSERYLPSCIFIDSYNIFMVVGGSNNFTDFKDIWSLNLNSTPFVWERIYPDKEGPDSIYGANAIYDKDFSRVIFAGGFISVDIPNEKVWALQIFPGLRVRWVELKPEGIPPDFSRGGNAVFDPGSRTIFFLSYADNSLFKLIFR